MTNPFERYTPRKQGDLYVVDEIFKPKIRCTIDDFCMRAKTRRGVHIIYGMDDIIKCNVAENGVLSYFQGLLGERLLSVVLEDLVNDMVDNMQEQDIPSECEVIREKLKDKGKRYDVTWCNRFVLKHKGSTNFYVLRKRPLEDRDAWYKAEKMGIIAREIDGLAYLHAGEDKYLLVGESKTIQSWGGVKDNYFQIVTEELFPPFRKLFPRHKLCFVFLARQEILYNQNELKSNPAKIADELLARDVTPIFIPFPKMERRLEDYAAEMARLHPVAKAAIKVSLVK